MSAPNPWWRTPIAVWSCAGVLCAGMFLWVMGGWILSGNARVSLGALGNEGTPLPGRPYETVLWITTVFLTAGAVLVIGWVVRDCRRHRAITFRGALLVGLTVNIWAAPMVAVHHEAFGYSTAFVNYSSWSDHIPGWHSPVPSSGMRETMVSALPGMLFAIMWPVLASWLIRPILRRRPALSGARLLSAVYLAGIPAVLLVTWFMSFTGMVTSVRGTPGLTLFAGQWFQLSLVHDLVGAVLLTTTLVVPYHYHLRAGHDDASIWRGLNGVPARLRTPAKVLSGVALANVAFLSWILGGVISNSLTVPMPPDTFPFPYPYPLP
ncbi:spirocyclase AveC family protein [Streptomyces sp. NPDC021093]|uniref:spirocyclase AveC family protein n=1 Tax=Streptomyces sp. NPDC021093 TaxID=3365112 RepID=UPI0037897F49